MRNRLLELMFVRGRVESVQLVSERLRQIRLAGPALKGLEWKPGQQVRINVAADRFLPVLRTYSMWDYQESTLDLYVFDHADGPGARWAREMRAGQEVQFTKPQGDFTLRPAAYHLFVGEETASVAFGPMMRAVPGTERLYGVVEVDSPDDQLPLPDGVTWRHRHGAPAADSSTLVAAVRELDLPAEPGVAYVAGEARTIQAARAHLVNDRGWPRRSVVTKPFWTPGKKGLE